MIDQLPDKLSDLIDLAIDDALSLDRAKYIPCHDYWHQPSFEGEGPGSCAICFAGAAIAGTLKISPDKYYSPGILSSVRKMNRPNERRIFCKLHALEAVRIGNINAALMFMSDTDLNFNSAHRVVIKAAGRPEGASFFRTWSDFERFLDWAGKVASELRKLGY